MQRVLVPGAITPAHPPINCPIREFSGQSMGTMWSVRFVDTSGRSDLDWLQLIQAQLDLIVAQMSHWEDESDLGRYNRALPGTWQALPEEFAVVMRCALDVAAQSAGAYDPAAGTLVNLWGFGPHGRHAAVDFVPPDAAAVGAALADCGWQRVRLDDERRIFQPGGIRLDFSSIAKGYAVDLLSRCLESYGVEHHLVEVGGELRGAGMKSDGQPWWVGLEDPNGSNLQKAVLALHGLSIATSGDYRRYFEYDGRRYAHTLDPRSGYPIADGVASVTVIHAECMLADAWSTALTVMGVEAGLACAEERAFAARFLVREGDGYQEHLSSAFKEMLQ